MFITNVRLDEIPDRWPNYLKQLPVVQSLVGKGMPFRKPVTVIVGDNGSGKSTLLEAIAVSMRLNPEGGSRNSIFDTTEQRSEGREQSGREQSARPASGREQPDRAQSGRTQSVSQLHQDLIVRRSRNPRDAFFLRGETFLNLAEYMQKIGPGPRPDKSLHDLPELSHGQGLLALLKRRFHPNGLFILDEPEDGLSMFAQLEVMGQLTNLANKGAQVIMATHSPLFIASPGANIVEINESGFRFADFESTEAVQTAREFVSDPIGVAEFVVHGDPEDQ